MALAVDRRDHLIEVPASPIVQSPSFGSHAADEDRLQPLAKTVPSKPHEFMNGGNCALEQKVLDIRQR